MWLAAEVLPRPRCTAEAASRVRPAGRVGTNYMGLGGYRCSPPQTTTTEVRAAMTSQLWPAKLPVRHVRIARPTDQLDEVVRFYCKGLGLPELDRFAGHGG